MNLFSYLIFAAISASPLFTLAQQETENSFLQDIELLTVEDLALVEDSLAAVKEIQVAEPEDLFLSLPKPVVNRKIVNRSFIPRVFSGYRKLHKFHPDFLHPNHYDGLSVMTYDSTLMMVDEVIEVLPNENESMFPDLTYLISREEEVVEVPVPTDKPENVIIIGEMPHWLSQALTTNRVQEDLLYSYLIDNPESIEYSYWDLPEPPELPDDDVRFITYIRRLNLPDVDPEAVIIPATEIKRKYWLHKVGAQLQFSQAFVSPNWYQGGNNYLALLFNFDWNVQLNQVFHPNLLFQSNLSYKLALSSNPKGNLHKYTISEDALQYNLNVGLKAFGNWYYSYNLLFKTQLLNNYEDNSMVRTASFLSPGDLNMGLGMAYNHQNKLKTFKYTLTISPLSYNLKTCISDKINHEIYNISPNRKVRNEIGSNLEFNMDWSITANISYKTRLFLFSDYHYFLSDWQNTFSFDINKFLSTQIFLHMRYDTSADKNTGWKTFMMREILSFGLSYTFSTKP
ncbi:MAG: DUF3078 domain-containing protein [Muribaculaceae bacterium]|nr:DUF3078 domain-containing protein [Muribaculaceae bacterium]